MNPKADDYLNGSPVSKPEEGQFELKGLTGFFSQDFEENNPSARSDYVCGLSGFTLRHT